MLEQINYKVIELGGAYEVLETRRNQQDWEVVHTKSVFSGNLSDCNAYIELKEKGIL